MFTVVREHRETVETFIEGDLLKPRAVAIGKYVALLVDAA